MSNYLIWRPGIRPDNFFRLSRNILGIEDQFELHSGISRAKGWPKDAFVTMDERDRKKDIKSADTVYGTGLIIVSKKLKEFLEKEELNKIEFLAVTVKPSNNRKAPDEPYFVFNPLQICDCIDTKASK